MASQASALGTVTDRVADPEVDPTPDTELMQRLVAGSEDALAELYDRYGHIVFAAAVRTGRDREIAAEATQETFLTLWDRAELFDPSRGTLGSWLATIARNRTIDHLRAAGRHGRAASFSSFDRAEANDRSIADRLMASGEPVAMAGGEPGPEAVLVAKETRASIKDALASLGPLERSVILLAYDEGLSQAEIATRLGWPIGTVKTRTRRAHRHLREWLNRPPAGSHAPATLSSPASACSG